MIDPVKSHKQFIDLVSVTSAGSKSTYYTSGADRGALFVR
jgi:hypothetical protein